MKKLLLLSTLLVLTACEKTTMEVTANYVLPADLQDCKIYKVTGSDGERLHIVRCANHIAVRQKNGKSNNNTSTEQSYNEIPKEEPVLPASVVVNGVEYKR